LNRLLHWVNQLLDLRLQTAEMLRLAGPVAALEPKRGKIVAGSKFSSRWPLALRMTTIPMLRSKKPGGMQSILKKANAIELQTQVLIAFA
jgi:hypothetical protein